MEEEKPGFEFRPYDEELVGYYLRHKILGNDNLVDGVIRSIKICSFDPWDLRFQSKIKSRDLVWYFVSLREDNGVSRQSRRTPSGFWKLTGDPVDVNDRWGNLSGFRGKIGYKRVLTFGKGKSSSSKSDWVMHELHYTHTDLPEHKRTAYVICRLEYKGDDVNILSAAPTFAPTMANSASSVVDQSFHGNYNTLSEYDSAYQRHQFNGNNDTPQQSLFQGYSEYFNSTSEYDLANPSHWFNNNLQQQQAPYSAPYQDGSDHVLKQVVQDYWPYLVDERPSSMREDPSHYRPKTPVTGTFPDDSSDDDTDSTIGRDTWSSTDSVGSKDVPYHTPKDDTSSLSTIEPLHNHEPQEQPKQLELQLQLQGKEKKSECEWEMTEDSTKKVPSTTAVKQSWIVLEEMSQRNSRWIHLKNMIIGFLLFTSVIGWIILVG